MSERNEVTERVSALLRDWLGRVLSEKTLAWLDAAREEIGSGAPERRLFLAYSGAVHRCGKEDLAPTSEDLDAAAAVARGWDPSRWSRDEAARALLLLSLPDDDGEAWGRTLDRLRETADVGEAAAFFKTLPLLPHPERHVPRATEGLRTNMTGVFESLACRNPYPAANLPEPAWNQMVLKAVFVGCRLREIVGLDDRANPALSRMLADYAHERWAASRTVDPELWRAVGPHADVEARTDLARVLAEGDLRERRAAALALASCADPEAREILEREPALAGAIADGTLTWSHVAEETR